MISDELIYQAAAKLNCDTAAILAVSEVESNSTPFNRDGSIYIRFEANSFYRRTNGIHGENEYSKREWQPKLLKTNQVSQHILFEKASFKDNKEAILSTSFGMFQIMGFNFRLTGIERLDEFIDALQKTDINQLDMFVNFILNVGLDYKLRNRDWLGFAKEYHGRSYYFNKYDKKLEKAYIKYLNMKNLDL